MARAIEHADDDVRRCNAFGFGHCLHVLGRGLGKIDDPVGIAGSNRQLVHINVGRIEQATFRSRCKHGQGVRARFCGDGGAFERVERDIDLGSLARRTTDLLPDEKHRCFVAFALADHHRAVHVERVERLAHGFHRSGVRRLLVATANQLGGGNGRRFGHADHFENEDAIERIFGRRVHNGFSPSHEVARGGAQRCGWCRG